VILCCLNEVLTSEEPDLRLSVKEVHGLVALLHKGGGSKDRTSDYRPVVLLNSLFQLVYMLSRSDWLGLWRDLTS
jgi:hypothetical protein